MSDISEEAYAAGWLMNLEYDLWQIVVAGSGEYGRMPIDKETVSELRALSDACGGWIVFDDEIEETFVPMERWLEMFAAYEARRPRLPTGD